MKDAAPWVIGGLVIAGLAGHGTAATAPHHAAAGLGTTRLDSHISGTLDCAGLESLWESAGGSPGAAFTAAEIAEAESSGRQYAASGNGDGTVDRGFWQVNSSHGSLSTFDAYGNARAAVLISDDGRDWGPWTTYTSRAYQGKC